MVWQLSGKMRSVPQLDLNHLTEEERDVILGVLRRDEELQKKDQDRITWVSSRDVMLQSTCKPVRLTDLIVCEIAGFVWAGIVSGKEEMCVFTLEQLLVALFFARAPKIQTFAPSQVLVSN